MDLQLAGKNALVTGATRGIGRAIAESFAAEGCNVAICARKADQVEEAVAALEAQGVRAFGQVVDAGSADALAAWVEASAEALGGIDTVVSNVSGGNGQDEAAWRANFEHDLMGAVRLVGAATPHLVKSDSASIVMISTTAAVEKFISAGPYNALKAALIQYAGALSQDIARKGIRVNTVSPGPIFIEGGAWGNIKEHMTAFYDATLAEIPMGRMGTAQEVADQVVFLASPRAGFTTGTNVIIDGGITRRIQF